MTDREFFVENDVVAEEDPVSIPLDHPCELCHRRPATVCTSCYDEAAQRTVVERAAVELLLLCRETENVLSCSSSLLHRLRVVLTEVDPFNGHTIRENKGVK